MTTKHLDSTEIVSMPREELELIVAKAKAEAREEIGKMIKNRAGSFKDWQTVEFVDELLASYQGKEGNG